MSKCRDSGYNNNNAPRPIPPFSMKLFHGVVVALVLAISTIPCSHGRWNLLSKKRTTTVEKKNGSWRFPWKSRKTDDEPPSGTRTPVQSLKQKRRWGNKSEKIQEKKSLGKKSVTEETNSNEKKRKLLKTNSTQEEPWKEERD